MEELHRTFAHFSPVMLRRLLSIRPKLRKLLTKAKGTITCQTCNLGKLTRAEHKPLQHPDTTPLSTVSTDIAGPFTQSVHGNKYLGIICDRGSKFLEVLPAKSKSAVGPLLVQALRRLQLSTGYQIKRMHSDGAPELCEGAPKLYANSSGITITRTAPDAPASNGQAERAVRTLKDCMRSQLADANLPNKWWDEAARDCVTKYNSIPFGNGGKSPHEVLFGKISNYPNIAFGTRGVIPDRSQNKKALAARSIACRYISPQSESLVTVVLQKGRLHTARAADFVPTRTKIDTNAAGSTPSLQDDAPVEHNMEDRDNHQPP